MNTIPCDNCGVAVNKNDVMIVDTKAPCDCCTNRQHLCQDCYWKLDTDSK